MKTSKYTPSSSKMAAMDLDSPCTEYEEAGFILADHENMEEEANNVSSPWSELPPHIIEKIYSFLDRHNQRNMSLVCRSWANEYGSPSLWRNMILSLPKSKYNIEISPEVRLARKYGAMFQHVEIICNCYHSDLKKSYEETAITFMWEQLHLFLQTLMLHSQLLSLTFTFEGDSFQSLEDDNKIMFDTLFGVIKNLIMSQNKLQSLEFENFVFEASKAVDLFRIIFTKNTLKELFLREFVELIHVEILENPFEDVSDLENLMNLEVWTLDYSQIFENIMTNFYKYGNQSHMTDKKWKLQIMKLQCYAFVRFNCLGISSSVWKYIRKVCPQLKINLNFVVALDISDELDLFITRYMPITSIKFIWMGSSGSDQKIYTALRHLVLCGINEILEELSIECFSRTTNLASDLKNFLKNSPKLRMLSLYMNHRIEGLHTLFNDWLENRPISLETVDITLRSTMDERFIVDDFKNFSDLANEFVPALKKLGLNLSLNVY